MIILCTFVDGSWMNARSKDGTMWRRFLTIRNKKNLVVICVKLDIRMQLCLPSSNQPKYFYLNPSASSCLHYHTVMVDVWCLNSRNSPPFSSSSLASISPPPRCNPPLLISSVFCCEFSTSALFLCSLQRFSIFPIFTFKLLLQKCQTRTSNIRDI